MFDRKSYLDTISALRADPDKLEEIIKMKENDRRHIPHSLRPVAAVAAALALLGISLAQDGHFTFQQQSESTVLDLTVTGSVQDWTLTCSVHGEGEEGPVYTYTGGEADSSTVTVDTGGEVSGVVSAEPKESGLTAASVTPAG